MNLEYSGYIKQYFNSLEQWMSYFGFSSMGVEPNWLFDKSYKRDKVEASKFGKVNTYCFVKYAKEPFDSAKLQQFSSQSFDYAMKYRQGMPLGLGGSLVVYPCLIVDKISKEHTEFLGSYLRKHYSAFEFPGILDISTGIVYCYSKTPMWGALYYSGFRKEIGELYSPVLWNRIAGK